MSYQSEKLGLAIKQPSWGRTSEQIEERIHLTSELRRDGVCVTDSRWQEALRCTPPTVTSSYATHSVKVMILIARGQCGRKGLILYDIHCKAILITYRCNTVLTHFCTTPQFSLCTEIDNKSQYALDLFDTHYYTTISCEEID